MTAGAAVLAVMSVASGELGGFKVEAVSTDSILAMAYLTVIGSLLAFTAYGWLLRVAPLPLIATYAYVNPIVAVILGGLVRSEPIELRTLIAGAVIVVAVAVIVTARGRMSAPRASNAVEPGPTTSGRGPSTTPRRAADVRSS
jgi:drug/metabolite transporter (DMT)-like permease